LGIDYPVQFSNAATGIRTGVPELGEHSREYLSEVGYNSDELDLLAEEGVLDEP
jgi:crotonobetainyl-CoA:carnitine CoA-transferase CaiB-like acyl-CoA transferase